MGDIELEVDAVHRARGIAILSDGQEVPITNWIDIDGNECDYADAVACACGPDFDGNWYAVALGSFTGAIIQ
ncbi:hypothetical protein [Microcystis phage Mel-JY03]